MEKKLSIKIIIATHKLYQMPKESIYLPLQVGAAGKKELGYAKDNTGENISSKNACFCELTGLYWAWKNLKEDYIGLVHYRRYFSYKKKDKNAFDNVLTSDEAKKIIENYDIIVPKKRKYYIETLYSHYCHTHYGSQLDETRKIIEKYYADFIPEFDVVMKRTWGYMFNMMIMRKELLDEYCTWLFKILFELEKRVMNGEVKNSQELSAFQGRFYGRISEIIFNVWLEHIKKERKIVIKELSCINMEKIAWRRKISSFFYAKFFGKKYEGSF